MKDLEKRIDLEALVTEREGSLAMFKASSNLSKWFNKREEFEEFLEIGCDFSDNMDLIAEKMRALNEPQSSDQSETVKRLMEAINWLMGCKGDFIEPSDSAEKYWYRSGFARRAGIIYDNEKLFYVIGGME